MGEWPHLRPGADYPEVPSMPPAMRSRRMRCLPWVTASLTTVTALAASSLSAALLPSMPTSVLAPDVSPRRPPRCTSSELSFTVWLHGSPSSAWAT
jgi:hypothetical protein